MAKQRTGEALPLFNRQIPEWFKAACAPMIFLDAYMPKHEREKLQSALQIGYQKMQEECNMIEEKFIEHARQNITEKVGVITIF